MNTQDRLLLLVQPEGEILVEAFEIVDARFGEDLLSVRGYQGRPDFLAALDLLIIFIDQGALELGHLNIYTNYFFLYLDDNS